MRAVVSKSAKDFGMGYQIWRMATNQISYLFHFLRNYWTVNPLSLTGSQMAVAWSVPTQLQKSRTIFDTVRGLSILQHCFTDCYQSEFYVRKWTKVHISSNKAFNYHGVCINNLSPFCTKPILYQQRISYSFHKKYFTHAVTSSYLMKNENF